MSKKILIVKPKYKDFTHDKFPGIELRLYPSQTRTIAWKYDWEYWGKLVYKQIDFPPLLFASIPYPQKSEHYGKRMLAVGALRVRKGVCQVARLPIAGIHSYACCLDTGTHHFAFKCESIGSLIEKFWGTLLQPKYDWDHFLKWFSKDSKNDYYNRIKTLDDFLKEASGYPNRGFHH